MRCIVDDVKPSRRELRAKGFECPDEVPYPPMRTSSLDIAQSSPFLVTGEMLGPGRNCPSTPGLWGHLLLLSSCSFLGPLPMQSFGFFSTWTLALLVPGGLRNRLLGRNHTAAMTLALT